MSVVGGLSPNVIGLHPEELLDRELRGELSEIERERLLGHVAQCSACRAERLMRGDFALELAGETGEDVPLPNLAGLLPSAASAPAAPLPQAAPEAPKGAVAVLRPQARAPRRVVRRSRTLWFLVAAALVVVSAAAGAGVRGRTWLRLMTSTFVSEPPPAGAVTPAASPAKQSRASHAGPANTAPLAVDATESSAPAELAPLALAVPQAVAPAVALPVPLAVPVPPPAAALRSDAPIPPAALFDAERSARLRGDYARVLSLHQELLARYPQSREAQVSRATVGQLLLDRGDPTSALASFDGFLSGGSAGTGQLAEVALVGRATALDRLGRTDEAANAWRALLVAFPDTPYAKHAVARVGAPSRSSGSSDSSESSESSDSSDSSDSTEP